MISHQDPSTQLSQMQQQQSFNPHSSNNNNHVTMTMNTNSTGPSSIDCGDDIPNGIQSTKATKNSRTSYVSNNQSLEMIMKKANDIIRKSKNVTAASLSTRTDSTDNGDSFNRTLTTAESHKHTLSTNRDCIGKVSPFVTSCSPPQTTDSKAFKSLSSDKNTLSSSKQKSLNKGKTGIDTSDTSSNSKTTTAQNGNTSNKTSNNSTDLTSPPPLPQKSEADILFENFDQFFKVLSVPPASSTSNNMNSSSQSHSANPRESQQSQQSVIRSLAGLFDRVHREDNSKQQQQQQQQQPSSYHSFNGSSTITHVRAHSLTTAIVTSPSINNGQSESSFYRSPTAAAGSIVIPIPSKRQTDSIDTSNANSVAIQQSSRQTTLLANNNNNSSFSYSLTNDSTQTSSRHAVPPKHTSNSTRNTAAANPSSSTMNSSSYSAAAPPMYPSQNHNNHPPLPNSMAHKAPQPPSSSSHATTLNTNNNSSSSHVNMQGYNTNHYVNLPRYRHRNSLRDSSGDQRPITNVSNSGTFFHTPSTAAGSYSSYLQHNPSNQNHGLPHQHSHQQQQQPSQGGSYVSIHQRSISNMNNEVANQNNSSIIPPTSQQLLQQHTQSIQQQQPHAHHNQSMEIRCDYGNSSSRLNTIDLEMSSSHIRHNSSVQVHPLPRSSRGSVHVSDVNRSLNYTNAAAASSTMSTSQGRTTSNAIQLAQMQILNSGSRQSAISSSSNSSSQQQQQASSRISSNTGGKMVSSAMLSQLLKATHSGTGTNSSGSGQSQQFHAQSSSYNNNNNNSCNNNSNNNNNNNSSNISHQQVSLNTLGASGGVFSMTSNGTSTRTTSAPRAQPIYVMPKKFI